MQKLGIAILALGSLVAGSAMAADMALKAPAPAAAVYSWTGFYIGGGGGYGMWSGDTTTVDPVTGRCALCATQTQGGRGGFGTVYGGYDYQFASRFVAGVFADGDFGDISGTLQDQDPFFAGTLSLRNSWAVGARLGYLLTPSIMTYVNAGYTNASFSGVNMFDTRTSIASVFSTPSFRRDGWFVGGGAEMMVAPSWILKAEYRLADYGRQTLADTSPPAASIVENSITIHPYVQTFRTGLAYKFNTPGGASFAEPLPAPVNWTGVYLAGGGGYGMWAANTTTVAAPGQLCFACLPFPQTQGGRGAFGTVGFGYDYQFNDRFVAGVLADADFGDIHGTIQDQQPFFGGRIALRQAYAVGARLGYLPTSSVMAFVSGGYASATFSGAAMNSTFNNATTGSVTDGFTRDGWFVGGGAETSILPNVFAKMEYRYADYGSTTLADHPVSGLGGAQNSITFHPVVQTVRTTLSYKFNWGSAPVVAKY